jgi:hypothetical protein
MTDQLHHYKCSTCHADKYITIRTALTVCPTNTCQGFCKPVVKASAYDPLNPPTTHDPATCNDPKCRGTL